MPEDIAGLGQALRSGALTAQDLLHRYLERIERRDGSLNSFVAIDYAGAERAARESDERLAHGKARSLLDGIPLSIKDNLFMKGVPATWGSRALKDFVPQHDELPVARLRQAGAVLLGKTNVPELTLEGYTANDLFGVTRNPVDTRLTPGGSSGGAVAGVAAGLVPAAIGTDGGGSIRRPACHTGLVGWKPSTGRIARADGFPAILHDFEVIGTATRTVDDAILLDGVLKGAHPADRRSWFRQAPPRSMEKPRILYIPQFGESPVDPEISRAMDMFAERLARQGADVELGKIPFNLDLANQIWCIVSRSGVAYLMRHYPDLAALGGASVQAMAQDGRTISGADYTEALEGIAALRADMARLFTHYDLIVTPSAAALPWRAEDAYPDLIDAKPAGPRDHAVFTGWVNIAGLPAISLPVATSRAGCPIGAQLVAGYAEDDILLTFSKQQELHKTSFQ
ncbi:amidase [Allorhizobium sp. BGMRC 0089]|nr:amidase [Allorhizobium sonneratiae]